MNFTTGEQLLELCGKDRTISQVMLEREIALVGGSREEVYQRMLHSYGIMRQSAVASLQKPMPSIGGLIGGEAKKLEERRRAGPSICGDTISRAIAYAMGVLEVNASMGLIVAAPTAGSSGVLPGVLLAVQQAQDLSDDQIVEGLFNAAAVGYLIAHNATVSGAEGGCQAEVGAASAMAASALVELMGGSPEQCLSAAAMAICNTMGLVCDPIAGLVEAPCQSRNALGASNAMICAEIALAGVCAVVPFDETVEAMYRVGCSLPRELRETALGGIAAAPTARRIQCGGGCGGGCDDNTGA